MNYDIESELILTLPMDYVVAMSMVAIRRLCVTNQIQNTSKKFNPVYN